MKYISKYKYILIFFAAYMLLFAWGSVMKEPPLALDGYYVSFDNGKTERRLTDAEADLVDIFGEKIAQYHVMNEKLDYVRSPAPKDCAMILRYNKGALRLSNFNLIFFVKNGEEYELYEPASQKDSTLVSPVDGDVHDAIEALAKALE